jgi:hypothetical protein
MNSSVAVYLQSYRTQPDGNFATHKWRRADL